MCGLRIGNEQSVVLVRFGEVLERCRGRKTQIEMPSLQAGGVPGSETDMSELIEAVAYTPKLVVDKGVANFALWYQGYHVKADHG